MSIEDSIKKLFAYNGLDVNQNQNQQPQKPKWDPKVNCGACYMKLINSQGATVNSCFYTCDFSNGRTASQECDRVAQIAKKEGRLVGSHNFVLGEKCR